MSEPHAGPKTGSSAGALLRAAREKQGLHIAALAAAIKVSPRKLDALENDRWHELPDATFTRALAQTVCRSLKIDARPVLELLPAPNTTGLEHGGSGLNAPFHDRPGREDTGLAGAAIRPMIWIATLLMIAAVVVYLLPEDWLGTTASSPAASAPVVAEVMAPVEAASAVFAESASAVAPAASAPVVSAPMLPPVIVASAPAVAPAITPTPAPIPARVPAPVVAAPVASAPAPVAASNTGGIVQLRTTASSWIEVRDARGQLLLSRIVQPGDNVGLDGALPIRLTIGNAGATQLGFRGKPVDLTARTRDNVARVELQ